ncbi:MAG TPA: alpha/beta hydrolase [Pseudobdellovibrionaceae bacterium]|nr:alpha/beta hydrolase [Pseudobdellovibrionaceae bacterium]
MGQSFDGKIFRSDDKKFAETIVLVHFYEGDMLKLARHREWLNFLGFDVYGFNMRGGVIRTPDISRLHMPGLPISQDHKFGYKHLYADQVESALNQVPGQKIIYAFSNISGAAIEAINRRNCADVKALICDSGPSLKLIDSVANLVKKDWNPLWGVVLNLAAPLLSLAWSSDFHRDIRTNLSRFPQGFPVLSIEGGQDAVIPPDHIELVFKGLKNLRWSQLVLPEAGHLDGLKRFPNEYKRGVEKFLLKHASPIEKSQNTDLE